MTEKEKWQAVLENDTSADGAYYYAVKSTGIYCRPSCKSKAPRRENVRFFDMRAQAEEEGFRPCKRCRPDLDDYQPLAELAQKAKALIERHHRERGLLAGELQKLGVSGRRLAQIFKQNYGMSPAAYADSLRIRDARARLETTDEPILDIAYELGFESASSFYASFSGQTGAPPGAYRRQKGKGNAGTPFAGQYLTAIGDIVITANESAITGLSFGPLLQGVSEHRSELTDRAAEEIEAYLEGRRTEFSVPLAPEGTEFQQKVWRALLEIPYGQTRSYGQIAAQIGNPAASRAVGMANHNNPIAIIIPCHRVVGADGMLTGYAGGLDRKRKLLELEKTYAEEAAHHGDIL